MRGGKGDKDRAVGLLTLLADELLPDTGGNVVTGTTQAYTAAALQRASRLPKRAGVDGTFHKLLARFATIALADTGNLLAVSRTFGHSSPAVTPVSPGRARRKRHEKAMGVGQAGHTRPVTDTPEAETLDLSNTATLNASLRELLARFERADELHRGGQLDFTERRMDEQKPAGKRAYILAHQLIGTATENYWAIFSLFEGAAGVTPVAPFNLARPAFEAALLALWILDPHDPVARCVRGLQVAIDDNRQRKLFDQAIGKLPFVTATDREQLAQGATEASESYRRDALELGVSWERASRRMIVVDEIAQLSYVKNDPEQVLGPILQANWRQLSGYQHGLMWAILRGSARSVETKIPGGMNVRLTVADSAMNTALQSSGLMLTWAIDTFLRRCRRPSSPAQRTV